MARSSLWTSRRPGRPAQHTTSTDTTRYGTAVATSWDRLHPRLTRRTCWIDHDGELPIIEGTLIRLQVEHLPGDRDPKPVWLWSSTTDATAADVDRCWQAFLRRFDLEHTFRLFKQTLGWTRPKIRDPAGGRPLDLADHRRPHPTPPRPAPRRRPAPPLGTTRPARTAHPGPGPPRVSEHPPDNAAARPRTETQPTRPRPTTRLPEPTPRDPATTSARPSNATAPLLRDDNAQVKDQAKTSFQKWWPGSAAVCGADSIGCMPAASRDGEDEDLRARDRAGRGATAGATRCSGSR